MVTTLDEDGRWLSGGGSRRLLVPEEYTALAGCLSSPWHLHENWTAEKGLAKFLPKKGAEDVSKLAVELQDYRNLIDVCSKKMPGASGAREGHGRAVLRQEWRPCRLYEAPQ